ncbi:hypothetical protein THMIRHAM_12580 [Thiomicrorhabdus immobilis]|uniref:Diguanylate cyclase n=1 Tax=Thiomicrorhabdus immobilis TaxID=2791037 RepID=A0ABM7MDP6_9GAMM|nr:EAL domain-containing protein [Thiomicrorhabdus immobilis]BCN93473.1 hypothetical protein THMIRHAM_12580 [Thiomicrorhabdus immobilis]
MTLNKNLVLVILILIQLTFPNLIQANEKIAIGILAFRPKPLVEAQWQPLADYLNRTIQGVDFKIVPYNYTELEHAIENKSIDFVFTNSSHFVQLAHKTVLSSPLATLINKKSGQPIRSFAGTILVKKDNREIKELKDLIGMVIATPSIKSFGGYKMQAYELQQAGIRVPDQITIKQTKMPHDKAVFAVISGEADAAFVRSGVLESLEKQGLIKPDQVRVLNQQHVKDFPFLTSTRLYPEWPFASMPHVGETLAGQVAGALLTLPHDGEVSQSINIYGFRVPADYEPVREVLRSLKVYPFNKSPEITFYDLWKQHQPELIALSLLIITVLILTILLLIFYRRLKATNIELKNNNESLRIAAVAFDTQESIFITDRDEKIIRVNNAFTQITGFSPKEVSAKTPRILKSGKHDPQFYKALWEELLNNGFWQGEIWNKRKNGEIFPVGQTITAIKDEQGKITHFLSTFNDITKAKANEERINKLAFYDPLTSLANRRLLNDHLQQAQAHSDRNKDYFALLFIDLDRFKTLNDTLGHDIGDLLLIEVGKRLLDSVREIDTVSRTGGDEFIILLEQLGKTDNSAAKQAKKIADKILQQLAIPYSIKGLEQKISASIGISIYTDHQETIDEMMVRSDLAMYQAKSDGRNTVRFFDPSMQQSIQARTQMETELRHAIQKNEFILHYQPKVDIDGNILGYEALIRWQHPEKGLLLPGEFISYAEDSGLIIEIGTWVIHKACLQLAQWSTVEKTRHLTLAVNINEQQIARDDFVEIISQALEQTLCPPHRLQLEITESLLMKEMEQNIDKINQLKEKGVTFAIDDFGTGYSSLNYLKKLPIDWLKIDRSFVSDMLHDRHDEAIVKTILALSNTLHLTTIAEGVETPAQAEHLIELGCPILQGYLFSEPKPIEELDI